MASCFLASASSRSSLRRSSTSAASALRQLVRRRLQQPADVALAAALLPESVLAGRRPVTASMRRTPAATALSPSDRDEADVAGARTCVPPHSSTE